MVDFCQGESCQEGAAHEGAAVYERGVQQQQWGPQQRVHPQPEWVVVQVQFWRYVKGGEHWRLLQVQGAQYQPGELAVASAMAQDKVCF